jgi:D-glycero-alpha-D-manno-heptose 1-phosphate guanylyltransferase
MVPAVILCGGLGTRLRGVLDDRPKCLAPIQGRTYLDFLTDYLYAQGVEDFVFATGYRHDQVEAWLESESHPWRWSTSRENSPLGTGGALRLAASKVEADRFFALNGDTFLEVDYRAMLKRHREAAAPITLAAVKVPDTSAFGRLEIADGYVIGFKEKGIEGVGLINGGVYTIERAFMLGCPVGALSFEKDVLTRTTNRVSAYLTRGAFLDIGTPEALADAEEKALTFASSSTFGSDNSNRTGKTLK